MAESYQYHYHNQQLHRHHHHETVRSRLGLRNSGGGGGGGEIVEVNGGHIVRSTGRKDRHSKVCTSKGPRDRRVRLSAHTAIQFYDVQDRLGYDRPSKAVDWLIKKAKSAIDKLAELPEWKPTATTVPKTTNPNSSVAKFDQKVQNPDQFNHFDQHPDDRIVEFDQKVHNPLANSQNSSFLPPSLDSDSIADTIKSFFPPSDPANNNQSQDLRLSLQSFKDPVYFNGSGWPENQGSWGRDAGGFVFSSQSNTTPFVQPLFGQTITNELFNNSSRREPLQSITTPSFRAWVEPLPPFAADHHHPTVAFHHQSSGFGGFSGFRVPAQIRGEEEEHDGVLDRPSSASSD